MIQLLWFIREETARERERERERERRRDKRERESDKKERGIQIKTERKKVIRQ